MCAMRISTFKRAAGKLLAAGMAAVLALGMMPMLGTGFAGGVVI